MRYNGGQCEWFTQRKQCTQPEAHTCKHALTLSSPSGAMSLLQQLGFELSVSSVCESDEEQFGGHHMLSPADDGFCWNSDKGSPQSMSIYFQQAAIVRSAHITFQGGYVGQDITIKVKRANQQSEWLTLRERIFVDDTNEEQCINIQSSDDSSPITAFQLLFMDSTDMFGRISVYHLRVEGVRAPAPS